ncbi:hypothetical protein HZB00_00345 [Candidatus Woesearchaeota archaeon]|nr:hypothetical protein [Candidatus Woesearchaeota archaeon]
MKYVMIAPVGDNLNALFVGIREFLTEKIFLLTPENQMFDAEKVKKDLERFSIPVRILILKGNMIEEMFRVVAEIKQLEQGKDFIMNIATGDKMSTCIALSAAFVHGMKAFGVVNGQPMVLPILKFSYYDQITERKMHLLKLLENKGKLSLEEMSKKSGMSLPLLAYHVNGTPKAEGLKGLGLIETIEKRGRVEINLSPLGRLLVKGYISHF